MQNSCLHLAHTIKLNARNETNYKEHDVGNETNQNHSSKHKSTT